MYPKNNSKRLQWRQSINSNHFHTIRSSNYPMYNTSIFIDNGIFIDNVYKGLAWKTSIPSSYRTSSTLGDHSSTCFQTSNSGDVVADTIHSKITLVHTFLLRISFGASDNSKYHRQVVQLFVKMAP
jgi:hypothetical protein